MEAFPVIIFYLFLKILPVFVSSALGGKLARWIGPFLPVTRLGLKNLALAFPEKSCEEHAQIMRDVWENLGRVVGEFPHTETISRDPRYIQVVHKEQIENLKEDGKAGIFFSAHMANWEFSHLVCVNHHLPMRVIAREPNNWVIRWFIRQVRTNPDVKVILKGGAGSKELLQTVLRHEHLGILVDQRLSEGEKLPFFNHPAFTTTAPAKLAHKFHIPLVPVQIERLKGCRFRITFYPPLTLESTPEKTTAKMNKILEEWIRQNPGQWLWLHNRWR